MQVDVFVAVNIGAEGDVLAVGRKLAAANLPLILCEPSGRYWSVDPGDRCSFIAVLEKTDVVVSIRRIRCDQYLAQVRTGRHRVNIVRIIALLALMRRKQRALPVATSAMKIFESVPFACSCV